MIFFFVFRWSFTFTFFASPAITSTAWRQQEGLYSSESVQSKSQKRGRFINFFLRKFLNHTSNVLIGNKLIFCTRKVTYSLFPDFKTRTRTINRQNNSNNNSSSNNNNNNNSSNSRFQQQHLQQQLLLQPRRQLQQLSCPWRSDTWKWTRRCCKSTRQQSPSESSWGYFFYAGKY